MTLGQCSREQLHLRLQATPLMLKCIIQQNLVPATIKDFLTPCSADIAKAINPQPYAGDYICEDWGHVNVHVGFAAHIPIPNVLVMLLIFRTN